MRQFDVASSTHEDMRSYRGEVFATFYTIGEHGRGYEDEAEHWHTDFISYDYVLARTKGAPTWKESVQLKPFFLKWLAEQMMDVTLYWVDVDARLKRIPPPIITDGDVWVRRRAAESVGVVELLGGTIQLNMYNQAQKDRVIGFLDDWCRELTQHGQQFYSDQEALQLVLPACERVGLDVRYLDPTMCWIFDLDKKRYPWLEQDVIISHEQASRRRRML